jgi:hypothetical protein
MNFNSNFFSSHNCPSVGFTDGVRDKLAAHYVGYTPNSYGIGLYGCRLSGKPHNLERSVTPIEQGTVFGCGIFLNSKNELAVFFTRNGELLGKLLAPHKLMI